MAAATEQNRTMMGEMGTKHMRSSSARRRWRRCACMHEQQTRQRGELEAQQRQLAAEAKSSRWCTSAPARRADHGRTLAAAAEEERAARGAAAQLRRAGDLNANFHKLPEDLEDLHAKPGWR